MVAGGITSTASALVLAPNEPCSVLSATAAGPTFCLKADPVNSRVQLTWSPSAKPGSVIVYYAPPQGTGGRATVTHVTDKGALVTGLKNDNTYTFWLAAGKTVESERVSATPLAAVNVPGTPAGLNAAPGDQQVTLSWDPPAPDSGLQVSGYNIYEGTRPGGETGTPVNSSLVTSTSYPVTGLTNGSTYYFTVKAVSSSGNAVNQVGNGETEGQASCEVSATPVTVPGEPAGLTATPGDQQVTLSWSAPASDGGSPVGGYNIYEGTSPGGETGTPVNSSLVTSTSYPVTGLTNGSTYYFTVKAVNAQGLGAASGEVLAVPVTAPGAPAGLTATPGDAKVTLTWSAPPSDGGSPVTGYNVYVATSADFTDAGVVPGVTGTALAVIDLVNGTPYYFRVTAVNKVGESQPSSVMLATPVTVPAAPAGLTAVVGNAQVTLKWATPASDGGSPVTGYDLYVGTTANFNGTVPLAKVTSNTVTVTGLANGATYYFRVTAVNKVGEGPASNEVPATPRTVPEAPAGLTATPHNSKVTLTWTAPASGGAPINGYIIYRGTSPGGETGTRVNGSPVTATSYTVTGLTSGTTYYFKVAAANAAGLSPLSGEASATLPVIVQSSPPPSSAPPSSTAPPPSTTPPSSTAPAFTAPTGLTATAGDTQVHLSWTAPTSDGGSPVASYKVYVAGVPGVQELPALGTAKTTDVAVTHLHNQAVYYFMVTAVDAAGNESPLSTEVSAEPIGSTPVGSVSLSRRPTVPPQLIALLAAVGAMAAAGAFTLIRRGRQKGTHPERSGQQTSVASDVRAVPDNARPDIVSVRDTGTEPTHTVRLEPRPGVSITTIKEGRT
jgi:predicted phage tail protein